MSCSLVVRSIAFCLSGVALHVAASAQQPALRTPILEHPASSVPWLERPSWVELDLPANFVGPTSLHALGTSIYFQTFTHVYLWSAITTKWVAVPVSPTALVTQFNAYITIEDGTTLHAFATRTGVVETLQLSGVPQVLHGSTSSCWLSIAVVGTDAWAFGAFDGTWHHQALQGAPTNVSISQTAGVFTDGTSVFGVSAYAGDFVPAPMPTSATIGVGGDVAAAVTPTAVAGFSAHTNQWAVVAVSNATQLALERGYALYTDGADMFAFSACTGTFATHPLPSGSSFSAGRYVAAAVLGNEVVAYSSGQNTFATRTFASAPALSISDEVLAVSDSSGVTAFSVIRGEFSDAALGAFFVQTNAAMVWIDDGVEGRAYCPVTGTWHPAPVSSGSSVQVTVLRNVVVLSDAQGYHAFSGRTGAWVSQASSTPTAYSAPTSGDVFAGFEGTRTHVFDPVIVRWTSVVTPAPVQANDIWRQTFVGFDGTTAVGFGLMNNAWSSIPTHGTLQLLDANSSCGFVLTNSHLYAYSAHGSLSTLSRFPEFSRLQPIGVPLRLIQAAPPGSQVVAILAHAAAYRPLQIGALFLDPASVFLQVRIGTVPQSGILDAPLDLSAMPSLSGTAVHIQTFVRPPHGVAGWYANSIAPIVL